MKIIRPTYEILTPLDRNTMLKQIENIGRVCYKSEANITETSAPAFVRMLIKRGHEAMIEHCNISIKFICDRGISHELVRHRIASFAQESTRYCAYCNDKFNNEITVIKPCFYQEDSYQYKVWENSCEFAEKSYFELVENGSSPGEARSVLPNSLKTEIVVTANIREWRHFFKERTAFAAHSQMREITIPLIYELKEELPEFFENIEVVNE